MITLGENVIEERIERIRQLFAAPAVDRIHRGRATCAAFLRVPASLVSIASE